MISEDPLVNPYSPGEALARLARLRGVLAREAWIASALPADSDAALKEAFDKVTGALESGDVEVLEAANASAAASLQKLYDAVCRPNLWDGQGGCAFAELAFSDPAADSLLCPVDVSTIVATHSQPERQVMTSISFEHAPGAKAYRLLTTRFIEDEDVHDDTITSLSPVFRRMRIPAGTHRLRIEARDHSGTAMSDEFTIVVPEPS